MKSLLSIAGSLAILVSLTAPALADPTQNANQSITVDPNTDDAGSGDARARLLNQVLQNASGAVQVNVHAGVGNQQGNSIIVNGGPNPVQQNTQHITATSSSQDSETTHLDGENTAWITDDVAADGSGAFQINVAAGTYNQQSNALKVATGNMGTTSMASEQKIADLQNLELTEDQTAYIDENAFQHFSGAAQVNVAAGYGNQQGNQMILQRSNETLMNSTASFTQSLTGFAGVQASDSSAYMADNAFESATGAVQVNIGAGIAGQQVNQLTVQPACSTSLAPC
ncbi:MAG: hypothetical protein NVS3B7_10320 [Candidatus Elarobacter sp.]